MHTEAPLPEDNNGRSRDNSDFEFPEDLMIQLGQFIGSFSQVDLVSNFGPEIAEKLEKQKLAGGEIEKKHQQLNQEWLLDGIDESQTFVPTDQVICHVSQQLSAVNCLAVIDPLSDQDIYHDNEGNVFIVHDKVQIASIGERRQEDLDDGGCGDDDGTGAACRRRLPTFSAMGQVRASVPRLVSGAAPVVLRRAGLPFRQVQSLQG